MPILSGVCDMYMRVWRQNTLELMQAAVTTIPNTCFRAYVLWGVSMYILYSKAEFWYTQRMWEAKYNSPDMLAIAQYVRMM